VSFNSAYVFDTRDRLERLTYPSAGYVTYTYDDADRVTLVKRNGSNFAMNVTYDGGGRLSGYTTGSVTHAFQYDDADRARRIQATSTSGGLDLTYSYDAVGNVRTIGDARPGMGQSFDYDPLYRLLGADGPWGQLRWAYDDAGNRRSETRGITTPAGYSGLTTLYTYQSATQRLTSTSGVTTESFTYDNAGRLVGDGRGAYGYNARGLLATFTRPGVTASYGYDASGLRLMQTVNSHTTYTVRDAGNTVISEWRTACAGAPVWSRDLVYAAGRPIGAVRANTTTPSVAFTAATATAGEAATSLTVGVRLTTSGATTCPVTVAYDTIDGTARAGLDYRRTSGTLTFPTGSANGAILNLTVPLLPDTVNEPHETFTVTLASATGATVASPAGQTVTITDDDAAPAMAIEAPTNGQTVKTPVTVSGWAIDGTAPTGTGVDIIHVYATPSGGSQTFLGAATYGQARPDIGRSGGAGSRTRATRSARV
jgi:YD repeat-containing protein